MVKASRMRCSLRWWTPPGWNKPAILGKVRGTSVSIIDMLFSRAIYRVMCDFERPPDSIPIKICNFFLNLKRMGYNGSSSLSFFWNCASDSNLLFGSYFGNSGAFKSCLSGTWPPKSMIYCSHSVFYLSNERNLWPLSAIMLNRSLVIAPRFPKARNQTLPLRDRGIP